MSLGTTYKAVYVVASNITLCAVICRAGLIISNVSQIFSFCKNIYWWFVKKSGNCELLQIFSYIFLYFRRRWTLGSVRSNQSRVSPHHQDVLKPSLLLQARAGKMNPKEEHSSHLERKNRCPFCREYKILNYFYFVYFVIKILSDGRIHCNESHCFLFLGFVVKIKTNGLLCTGFRMHASIITKSVFATFIVNVSTAYLLK